MSGPSTKILLIENNPQEIDRLRQAVVQVGSSTIDLNVASTLNEGLALLKTASFSAILANLNLPDSRGADTARVLHQRAPDTPMIVITGAGREDAGIQAMHQGAAGYMVQNEISGVTLRRELRHSIERKRAETDIKAMMADKEMLIGQLAAANAELDHARIAMTEMTIRDDLTGIYNRKELNRLMIEEIERSRRSKLPLALVLMDIDFFSKINDLYGHATGDKLLRQLGSLLSTNLRGTDKPARYGGEEFAILSPDLPKMAAAAMAERLRGIVAGHVFTISGEDKKTLVIPLTVSLGVAVYPDHGDTMEDIYKAADMAMYHAKDLGRNTVASLKGPPA
jgi:diguanylate cyclase (GGDEF)-like protein